MPTHTHTWREARPGDDVPDYVPVKASRAYRALTCDECGKWRAFAAEHLIEQNTTSTRPEGFDPFHGGKYPNGSPYSHDLN